MGKMAFGFALLVAVLCVVNAQVIEDKDGFCPPVNATFNSTNDWYHHECYSDSACIYDYKCCMHEDGIYRCTEPIPTTSTMKPTTEVAKYGECPSPSYQFGLGCNGTYYTCSHDSDCYGRTKCCRGFIDEGCSVCKDPTFNYSATTTMAPPPPEPTFKPHNFQPGVCPRDFQRFYGYDTAGITCMDYCNGNEDCGEGELCCVEEDSYYDDGDIIINRKRRDLENPRCPVCKKADFDCRGDNDWVYKHGEVYKPDSSDCEVCQCFQGQSNCYYVCKNHFWAYEWFAAGVAAGVALLISVIFTLSVCCCLKCCCKDNRQAVVMSPPPTMMAQQPGNFYYMPPRKEEKLTLTENDHSIA